MSLLNGLAAAAGSVSNLAGMMSMESMRSSLEQERMELADKYATARESLGRKESAGYQMDQLRAEQEFKRPLQDAQKRSLDVEANAKEAAEGRTTAAINAAKGDTGGGSGTTGGDDYKRKFMDTVRPFAEEAARKTGIDPKLIMAQAALESDWGRAAPGNNYFGIKGHGAPNTQTLETTEVGANGPVKTKDSFRTYNSPAESFEDYAKFIATNSRYRAVQDAKGLDEQIAAMGKSGYATDPQYTQKLNATVRSLGDGGAGAAPGSDMPPALKAAREALRVQGKTAEMAELDMKWTLEQNKRSSPTQGELERAATLHPPPREAELFKFWNGLSDEGKKQFQEFSKGGEKFDTFEHNGKRVIFDPKSGKAMVMDIPNADKKPPPDDFKNLERDARTMGSTLDRVQQALNENKGAALEAYINNPRSKEGQAVAAAFDTLRMIMRGPAFANTGVMQPHEVKMMDDTILSPQTWRGLAATPGAVEARFDEFRRFLDNKMDAAYTAYGLQKPETLKFYQERPTQTESDVSGVAAKGGPQGPANTPRPTDKAAFDALPSGAIFLDPNGMMRRKP